jgi:hypothetical protein
LGALYGQNRQQKRVQHLYAPPYKEVVVVEAPVFIFLMINGMSDPGNSQDYKDAVEALFVVVLAKEK